MQMTQEISQMRKDLFNYCKYDNIEEHEAAICFYKRLERKVKKEYGIVYGIDNIIITTVLMDVLKQINDDAFTV